MTANNVRLQSISHNYRHEELARLRALKHAISNSNIAFLYQTKDLKYSWSENLTCKLKKRWHEGLTDEELFPETAKDLISLKQKTLQSGKSNVIEIFIGKPPNKKWYKCHLDCDFNADKEIIGIITTLIDISDLKRHEAILRTLLREVSHRSKNLLAIVQAIANQTARYTLSNAEFIKKFTGRLLSLAQSQDLVTDSNWHGALFHDLARAQIARYVDLDDDRISIIGNNPYLFPSAALHMGLALHELIVNSTSYGALSVTSGRVEIQAHIVKLEDKREILKFRWEEHIPTPLILEKAAPRFGSTVLLRLVPEAVNGNATYKVMENGFIYDLELPDEYFDSYQ